MNVSLYFIPQREVRLAGLRNSELADLVRDLCRLRGSFGVLVQSHLQP